MIHEILPVGPLQCNCSILGDEIDEIVRIVERDGLKVKQILITHAHIDHVGGAMKLKQLTGAPILLNQNDQALLKMMDMQAAWVGMRPPGQIAIDQSVKDADRLKVGNLEATVMHTPGHTEGSICLYFPAEQKLIAGDTLFAGSIGRTDLPGGSTKKIMESLHTRVMALP